MRMIVPNSTQANVNVSVRIVPTVNGVGFFFGQAGGHRQRRDHGDEAAEEHHQPGGDVPLLAEGRGGRRIVLGPL